MLKFETVEKDNITVTCASRQEGCKIDSTWVCMNCGANVCKNAACAHQKGVKYLKNKPKGILCHVCFSKIPKR